MDKQASDAGGRAEGSKIWPPVIGGRSGPAVDESQLASFRRATFALVLSISGIIIPVGMMWLFARWDQWYSDRQLVARVPVQPCEIAIIVLQLAFAGVGLYMGRKNRTFWPGKVAIAFSVINFLIVLFSLPPILVQLPVSSRPIVVGH